MSFDPKSSIPNLGVGSTSTIAELLSGSNQPVNIERYIVGLRSVFQDIHSKEDGKLKLAQEIAENLEGILVHPQYPSFLDTAVPIFLKFLEEGEPYFVSEFHLQQTRKAVLDIIQRLNTNETLRPYVRSILETAFQLIEKENEENVIICLRILIELHKQYRPTFSVEVQRFLLFVRTAFQDLPNHLDKIFEPKQAPKMKDFNEQIVTSMVDEIYAVTSCQSDKKNPDGSTYSYNILPRAKNSLKVLQELPIIVVLMYQIYKANVQQDVADFIPIVMTTITLQPSEAQKKNPDFNKEVLVEFMGAQVKTLSFLAYVIKLYQDTILQYSNQLVNGLLNLLTICPMEVAYLRRELFIAARHIMATELRFKFVPFMEQLFNENILLGKGWTVNETMRPLAYSTLADLIHHVRQHLSLSELNKAVTFFSYHVHDESLPLSIQTMSCKLLFNLVDSIRSKSEQEGGNGREILVRILDVLVYKFKTISQVHIPYFQAKYKSPPSQSQSPRKSTDGEGFTSEDSLSRNLLGTSTSDSAKEDGHRFGFPAAPMHTYSFIECRTLVKTIVCAVKTISWGIATCKGASEPAKQFTPAETEVLLRLLKWGVKAVDIYAINGPAPGQPNPVPQRPINTQGVRSKEEKEVLEHFAGSFTLLNPYTFRELFSVGINNLVQRIHENNALQVVANNLLANPATSAVFATILVEFLLQKLPEMGDDIEKSNLYLRLFKLVFGSVSLFPTENEQMLRPHLREIVNRSMELALNAKDPYNYFLLLRALFRSIGGGSHDMLYQEFLPLLPSLLQGLNNLQSGLHRQHMKDLFVELCLTVPVRLSSLLPYLPMLMDPLVSALNGSPTLISQGLRTLELCVDNLQPDFLYEHIQPVRADLMQALWRTLRSPNDVTANVAFRILGKFGGSNRKMLVEPQRLEYGDKTSQGPSVLLYFQDHKSPVSLPVEKPIECAFNTLKSPTSELYYKKQAWLLLKTYLTASMIVDEDCFIVNKLMLHNSLHNQEIATISMYKYSDERTRQVHASALSGVFVAATVKELKREVYGFLVPLIRHYGMVAVAQQLGPFAGKFSGLDPYVLFDAAANVLAIEDKLLQKSVFFIISVLMNLLINLVGSKERACSLPMMEYLSEKICDLCYERAWYTKMGGCNAISFFLANMSHKWILSHHINILKAMLFVLTDLTGEVSSGASEAAKENIRSSLRICNSIQAEHLQELKRSSMAEVTKEFVRQLTSCNANIREESMKSLQLLAELQNKSLAEVIQPHREIIGDMIPPKKHLIRHQSVQSQLGILEGNSFCLSLRPKLFTIDLEIQEHKMFLSELVTLCEHDDESLKKLPCYKQVSSLTPVRIALLKVLAWVVVTGSTREKIAHIFLKTLGNSEEELQNTAFECLKKYIGENPLEQETITNACNKGFNEINPQTGFKNITLEVLREVSYLCQLFPSQVHVKLWEALFQTLRKSFEQLLQIHGKQPSKAGSHELKTVIAIIKMFKLATTALYPNFSKLLETLSKLCLQAEKSLLLGKGSPIRPALMEFLLLHCQEYIDLTFSSCLQNLDWIRFYVFFLQQTNANGLREVVKQNVNKVLLCLNIKKTLALSENKSQTEQVDIQYLGVKTVYILNEYDEQWILGQPAVIQALRSIWERPDYQQSMYGTKKLDMHLWKEPMFVAKLLTSYYKHNPDDIVLLFKLLLAFCGRTISQYQFLKDFLEETVTGYSVEWKRKAFFKFVEVYEDSSYQPELKAKIIQFILIPCMSHCFENGVGDEFVGQVPPMPDVDSPYNIVAVLLDKVIDNDNPNSQPDCVRILLCQLSCLLVEVAAAHIHDASNKKQGNKLRRLMTFAWPCLLSKTCVDSSTKYYGHLLLSHIIAKFAIHKRIVLQVFHSLLKASVLEAKGVVKHALEIITPALPFRMEDGNTMLIHWTKKILLEEGHSLSQLMHILQLIVRHWKVYYPVRQLLVVHMVSAIQRLGFTPTSTFEHRKLAVELGEVIIKWELERIKTEEADTVADLKPIIESSGKVTSSKTIERSHTDQVLNFLLRVACQVNEPTPTPGAPGELLSRRSVTLIKTVLKPDVWPSCDLKIAWFDKLLLTLESPQTNYPNICAGLDLLTYIIGILSKEQVLEHFKGLQKGIAACMSSQNSKVIKAVHNLMTKLMTLFPTDYPGATSTLPKCDELEPLYSGVSKVVLDGLTNYEKAVNTNPALLLGPLMMLKSASTGNPCYIDRLITNFMKVLQRLCREHLSPNSPDAGLSTELLLLSMDLVKNRVGVMGVEMRKAFIGSVLVSLIEKTSDTKVMHGIIKMLEEWMKSKTPIVINQGPSGREKSILLVKMMQNVEKRFSEDQELLGQFLELVNFIYRDEHLKSTELNAKLEPAFMCGLRCPQSKIRCKFFEVFDNSIRRKLHDRLMYILCSQNWEAMGAHFWVKQAIELLFSTVADIDLETSPNEALLPGIGHGYNFLDPDDRALFIQQTDQSEFKSEPMDVDTPAPESELRQLVERDLDVLHLMDSEDQSEIDEVLNRIEESLMTSWDDSSYPVVNVKAFLLKQNQFQNSLKDVKLCTYVSALVQLCHYDTHLAEKIWITFFPRAWKIFGEKQQLALANEIIPFLVSGVHVIQKDCIPSALNTFTEALCQCIPTVSLKPCVIYYLGKAHNLWHRMALLLENMAFDTGSTQQIKAKKDVADCYEFEPSLSSGSANNSSNLQQEIFESLSDLYSSLKEEDLWAGLWQKRAKYPETNVGIAFELQGFYDKAQTVFESAMAKARLDFETGSAPAAMTLEFRIWEDHWLKCTKELNQWDMILEYGKVRATPAPTLILESAWKVSNWTAVKEALSQIEIICPKEYGWRVLLCRGYLAICSSEDQNLAVVDRYVDGASILCIKEWRRLPHLVSNAHVGILQAAQQIVELHEATQIHSGILQGKPTSLHDMKAVVKTWRNRLPCISDDLSHWSDIFSWRQLHYQFISNHFDPHCDQTQSSNQAMLGVHALCQAICHFGKVARKQNLVQVSLDSLTKIYSIPSVPIVDCFQKIKQQVKCYIQQAHILGRADLQEALDIVESTNLKYFNKEMTSEFFALKGVLLANTGRSDEANKSFSAATQLNDTLSKSWGFWGDYLESVFTRDSSRNMTLGIAAVTAFMHACRHQYEPKARKYIAKILWLLMYDDEKGTLSDSVDKYSSSVPPIQWLPWVPQLLTSLVRHDGKMVINLLNSVGRMYPQAVYFPIRTLYLTLKIEQREKVRNAELQAHAAAAAAGNTSTDIKPVLPATSMAQDTTSQQQQQPTTSQPETQAIKATPSMWRCSRLMHMQRDLHPTVLSSLEGIVDQIIWFRENWSEELLRQLKIGLAKCYAVAFENRASVVDAPITTQLQNFVRKLVSTFGLGTTASVGSGTGPTSLEALLRSRSMQDPSFQQMKIHFTVDFDSSVPGALKLHNLIQKLRKWIKILETKTKLFAKSFLMEDRFRFLQNFSTQMAEIELPGEFLIPKHAHYYVKIARFQPRIEVVQKHNTSARRIFIRGHNGKIYPYLIVNDSGLSAARSEERVMQMTRMLNHYLSRQKITAKRNLKFTVPKVVAVSPQMRLVEDNPASLSLLDVFKLSCSKRGVEFDAAIGRYYDLVKNFQLSHATRGSQVTHQVLREILRDIQANLVPRTMVKEWALNTFAHPSDYWLFRKTFTLQLCLSGFAEYAFHLTRLNPEMMYLHQDSGMINISYFKFDVDDVTGDLESNRPVPFRLTPNVSEFITTFGINGPIVASMISLSRSLMYPNYKLQGLLRAILRDEMISWLKKKNDDRETANAFSGVRDTTVATAESDSETVINIVTKAVNAITNRLQTLSSFDGVDSKVATFIAAANSHDNLCRMDPAWHPWL